MLDHHDHHDTWPDGWREARYYLPLACPVCRRLRLLYALRTDHAEGILVRCEKCHSASYEPVEPEDYEL